jgi:hypothetical protein
MALLTMRLYSVDEIRVGLDEAFKPLEPDLVGYRFVEGGATPAAVAALEKALGLKLPDDLVHLICKYQFGDLSIGPVAFCGTGDYVKELLDLNTAVPWWRENERPPGIAMFANSEFGAFVIECPSGSVFLLAAGQPPSAAVKIADSFSNFVRAIGTIALLRIRGELKNVKAAELGLAVGVRDARFWERYLR